MSWPTSNGALDTPYGQEGNKEQPTHHEPTMQWQHAPVMIDNPPSCDVHWTDEPHRESHMSIGIVSNMSSWSDVTCLDPSSSVYGDEWLSDRYIDEAYLESLFGALGGNADGLDMSLSMGIVVTDPVLEQTFPVTPPSALPTTQSQSWPPSSLDWIQLPGPAEEPTCWEYPVHIATQHCTDSNSSGPGVIRTEIPCQQDVLPVLTGYRERAVPQTGPLPSASTHEFVQPLTHRSLVPDFSATLRPRGQRWPLSTASTFRCMWKDHQTWCTALIAGDRRSVSSHLRDVHDFTCDSQRVACQWGGCTAYMQRRNIPRHILTRHFEVRVECSQCGLSMSRADAKKKHQLACRGFSNPGSDGGN